MSARKNATPADEISDEESFDCEVFITNESRQRFTDIISGMTMFSIVKEFYENLVDSNKKPGVMVKGIRVSYSEGTINLFFKLKKIEDHCQEILNRVDKDEFEIYMQSLCNLGNAWVETGGEKIVKGVDLRPKVKAWY
ncbi:hypothetical protein RYX36_013689 [Vicia faba]